MGEITESCGGERVSQCQPGQGFFQLPAWRCAEPDDLLSAKPAVPAGVSTESTHSKSGTSRPHDWCAHSVGVSTASTCAFKLRGTATTTSSSSVRGADAFSAYNGLVCCRFIVCHCDGLAKRPECSIWMQSRNHVVGAGSANAPIVFLVHVVGLRPVPRMCLPLRMSRDFSSPLLQPDHCWSPSSIIACSIYPVYSLTYLITDCCNQEAVLHFSDRDATKHTPHSHPCTCHGLLLSNGPCVWGTHWRAQKLRCRGRLWSTPTQCSNQSFSLKA